MMLWIPTWSLADGVSLALSGLFSGVAVSCLPLGPQRLGRAFWFAVCVLPISAVQVAAASAKFGEWRPVLGVTLVAAALGWIVSTLLFTLLEAQQRSLESKDAESKESGSVDQTTLEGSQTVLDHSWRNPSEGGEEG